MNQEMFVVSIAEKRDKYVFLPKRNCYQIIRYNRKSSNRKFNLVSKFIHYKINTNIQLIEHTANEKNHRYIWWHSKESLNSIQTEYEEENGKFRLFYILADETKMWIIWECTRCQTCSEAWVTVTKLCINVKPNFFNADDVSFPWPYMYIALVTWDPLWICD